MKKFTYVLGILLFMGFGSWMGATELHGIISTQLQRFNSFPESGSLIVLGSVLIFGASLLRRRKAARSRSTSSF